MKCSYHMLLTALSIICRIQIAKAKITFTALSYAGTMPSLFSVPAETH